MEDLYLNFNSTSLNQTKTSISKNSFEIFPNFYHFLTYFQKQPSRGVLKERSSGNMQQIYRRAPMRKCNFSKTEKTRRMKKTDWWNSFFTKFLNYSCLWRSTLGKFCAHKPVIQNDNYKHFENRFFSLPPVTFMVPPFLWHFGALGCF